MNNQEQNSYRVSSIDGDYTATTFNQIRDAQVEAKSQSEIPENKDFAFRIHDISNPSQPIFRGEYINGDWLPGSDLPGSDRSDSHF